MSSCVIRQSIKAYNFSEPIKLEKYRQIIYISI